MIRLKNLRNHMFFVKIGSTSFRWKLPIFSQFLSFALLLLSCSCFCLLASAALPKKDLPAFLSLKNTPCNVRVGPGKHFPIEWVFPIKSMPVQILSKYHEWYKIKDVESSTGWIHKSMLSFKAHVLFRSPKATLYSKPNLKSTPVAVIKAGVIARLKKCENDWCEVIIEGHNGPLQKGYVASQHIWGI